MMPSFKGAKTFLSSYLENSGKVRKIPNIHLALSDLTINKHDIYETTIFFESISLFFVNHGIICCK